MIIYIKRKKTYLEFTRHCFLEYVFSYTMIACLHDVSRYNHFWHFLPLENTKKKPANSNQVLTLKLQTILLQNYCYIQKSMFLAKELDVVKFN